jgi:hypothetical protein
MGAGRRRAFGRSLGDFRLEGATTPNGLLPAEEKLLVDVARGKICSVSDLDWKKPEDLEKLKSDTEFRIRAECLRFLVLGGDDAGPVHEKGVWITRAYIEGDLDLEGCQPVAYLLIMDSYFAGALTLRDAHLRGVNLAGSRVGGIQADRARIGGSVLLRNGFVAEGEVRFGSAEIGGDFECDGSTFKNAEGSALSCDGVRLKGDMFLRNGFAAEGSVRLLGVEIGGDLSCVQGRFKNPGGDALNCSGAKIARYVYLRNGFTAEGTVVLSSAHAQNLIDDDIARGKAGACDLVLDGFTYERIAGNAPTTAKTRIAWLHSQIAEHLSSTDFRPQPFEQLAKVLAAMGHDGDARQVAMAKQRLMIPVRVRQAAWYAKPFVWLLWRFHQLTSGFGYRPIRLIFILLALWLAGAWFYDQAAEAGVFAPADLRVATSPDLVAKCSVNWTKCKDAGWLPGFYALTYSADVVLPVSDLGQRKAWTPGKRGFELTLPLELTVPIPPGLTTHIVAVQSFLGSLGALLFGAIITGLIKKD